MSEGNMRESLEELQQHLERLRTVVKAATPGLWRSGRASDCDGGKWYVEATGDTSRMSSFVVEPVGHMREADAEYIATFDPSTVLALLFTLEQFNELVEHHDEHKAIIEEHRRKIEELERRR